MSKLEMLKGLLSLDTSDNSEDSLLEIYLQIAERKVLDKLYPFDSSKNHIPPKYALKVVEIAQYLYYRRGSEGETSHSENGVNRSYENADIPESMLSSIVPMVGGMA